MYSTKKVRIVNRVRGWRYSCRTLAYQEVRLRRPFKINIWNLSCLHRYDQLGEWADPKSYLMVHMVRQISLCDTNTDTLTPVYYYIMVVNSIQFFPDSYARPSCALLNFLEKTPRFKLELCIKIIVDEKAKDNEGETVQVIRVSCNATNSVKTKGCHTTLDVV